MPIFVWTLTSSISLFFASMWASQILRLGMLSAYRNVKGSFFQPGMNSLYNFLNGPLTHVGECTPFVMESILYLSLIHISEPTRLGMISYAVFCLKKKKQP